MTTHSRLVVVAILVGVCLIALGIGLLKSREQAENANARANQLQADLDNADKQLGVYRTRCTELEEKRVSLVRASENAKKESRLAWSDAKIADAIAASEAKLSEMKKKIEEEAKKFEEFSLKWNEMRSGGREVPLHGRDGSDSLPSRPLGPFYPQRPPPPVLNNVRGEVTNVAGELVTVNIGIDSGLQVGTVLDVFRLEGGGKTIGTVKVTSALNLFPKQAIVSFTPARRDIPLDRLALEDLPKVGDQVRSPEALDTPAKTEK